jgi:hypothetical protein
MLSATTRIRWTPAFSDTVAVTSVHDCHPPVLGIVNGPVVFTPSNSTWNVPPGPLAATRAVRASLLFGREDALPAPAALA